MIQRIQSVFLFLAFLLGVLLFFFPIADLLYPEGKHVLYLTGLYKVDNHELVKSFSTIPLIVINAVTTILSFAIIFLFKNRKLQMKLCRLNMMLLLAEVVLLFVYIDKAGSTVTESTKAYGTGVIFPLLSLIFVLLANRGIKKDEELVRSADRIR